MNVLFVCSGNICRSPSAEGVFLHLLKEHALAKTVGVDSAGLQSYHVGQMPDPRACQVAKARGYDFSTLRARQVTQDDFARFDLILAMDEGHLSALKRMSALPYQGRIRLFMDFATQHPNVTEVPDPYYGKEALFREVLDMVEDGCQGLLAHLEQPFLTKK